ncbi:MAG: hypothetical protein Q9170_002785 [Blastenia crenularia]
MLPHFRVRKYNLSSDVSVDAHYQPGTATPNALISITATEYDKIIAKCSPAALKYMDDEDGEIVRVGSSLELAQRLDDPIGVLPRAHNRSASNFWQPHKDAGRYQFTSPTQQHHLFDVDNCIEVFAIWEFFEERTKGSQFSPKSPFSPVQAVDHAMPVPSMLELFCPHRNRPAMGSGGSEAQRAPETLQRRSTMRKSLIHDHDDNIMDIAKDSHLQNPGKISTSDQGDQRQKYFGVTKPHAMLSGQNTMFAPLKYSSQSPTMVDNSPCFPSTDLTVEGKRQAQAAGDELRARNFAGQSLKPAATAGSNFCQDRWALRGKSIQPFAQLPTTFQARHTDALLLMLEHKEGAASGGVSRPTLIEVFDDELAKLSVKTGKTPNEPGLNSSPKPVSGLPNHSNVVGSTSQGPTEDVFRSTISRIEAMSSKLQLLDAAADQKISPFLKTLRQGINVALDGFCTCIEEVADSIQQISNPEERASDDHTSPSKTNLFYTDKASTRSACLSSPSPPLSHIKLAGSAADVDTAITNATAAGLNEADTSVTAANRFPTLQQFDEECSRRLVTAPLIAHRQQLPRRPPYSELGSTVQFEPKPIKFPETPAHEANHAVFRRSLDANQRSPPTYRHVQFTRKSNSSEPDAENMPHFRSTSANRTHRVDDGHPGNPSTSLISHAVAPVSTQHPTYQTGPDPSPSLHGMEVITEANDVDHADAATVAKVQMCVDQLQQLGFESIAKGGLNRLVVYAQAAEGDLGEAIDLLEEDKRAYDETDLGPFFEHGDSNSYQPAPSSLRSSYSVRVRPVRSSLTTLDTTARLTLVASGTPNSMLSALSTTAIKDGHQGHVGHHAHGHAHNSSSGSESSTNTLDAERADRISRLAGLEPVATGRGASSHLAPGPSALAHQTPGPGYFDNAGTSHGKERSTVGSASATGSVGGRTTWASSSDVHDADKMSEDPEDTSSTAGLSDEGNASLVGFGEGASSTVSGPVSTSTRMASGARGASGVGSPLAAKQGMRDSGSPMQGVQTEDAKMLDGMTYDRDVVDSTPRQAGRGLQDTAMTAREQAENMMGDRLHGSEGEGKQPLGSPRDGKGLGKFSFEDE